MTRPRTRPVQNTVLEAAIARTGRTYASIARVINRVGEESGVELRCTAASLGKWLNGATPQQATMAASCEAFSRLLDRPVTAADLGWPESATTAPTDPWRGDPVVWITHLGRDDMLNRRTALTAGLYSLAAASLPAQPQHAGARTATVRRGGTGDVDRIRQTTRAFSDLDDLYGGGHARTAVAAYLTAEVAPLLRGTTGRARPGLFVAAAELSYLAGWMAADTLHTGLAQRYYIQAVRLAEEAADAVMRATALRSLAVQAVELGHNRAARDLADAAAAGVKNGSPARTRAWITGMCAEALAAADHDRHRAHALLRTAERELERADSRPEAEWVGNYRRESFAHQVGLTLTQLGDLPGAETYYADSVGSRRPIERRTRVLIGARLAHVQLRQRRPDDAARTLLNLSGDLNGVSSQRVRRTLTQIRSGWAPHRHSPLVNEADQLLAGAASPVA